MDIIILLLTRLPIMYLKAMLWAWLWRKIFKKYTFQSMEALPLTLPPIFLGFANIIIQNHIGNQINALGTIISNGLISIFIYFILQHEKKVKINVAGRINTLEYKRYSEVLGIPTGRINTDKLIQSYMAARRKAKDKEERELVEMAYLYFTDYGEYKKRMKQEGMEIINCKKKEEEKKDEINNKAQTENNELEETFRRRLGGRY